MQSILSNPSFQKRVLPLSVAAWHGMIRDGLAPERAELIRGVIIEKMSKSILHTRIAHRLFTQLQDALRHAYWVRKEDPLTFQDSEPEPDISVVTGDEPGYTAHPRTAALVIEVSISSLAEDRGMAAIYAEAGVEEYWVVNVPARCIEVFREPTKEGYTKTSTVGIDQVLQCGALPVAVEISALFAGV